MFVKTQRLSLGCYCSFAFIRAHQAILFQKRINKLGNATGKVEMNQYAERNCNLLMILQLTPFWSATREKN